eukprot:5171741-Prymnesium_polylepis.1
MVHSGSPAFVRASGGLSHKRCSAFTSVALTTVSPKRHWRPDPWRRSRKPEPSKETAVPPARGPPSG